MIIPTLRYTDAPAAIDFLERAFGFERKAVYGDGDVIHHAELTYGRGMVMLGSAGRGDPQFDTRQELGLRDRRRPRRHARSREGRRRRDHPRAPGHRLRVPRVQRDRPEGNVWSFGTYDPFAS